MMQTDVRPQKCELYFLDVPTRIPLKFGSETLTSVTCARVCMTVTDRQGGSATGWGETPLSVQWAWPSSLPLTERAQVMRQFCVELTQAWADFAEAGHALEVGHTFIEEQLPTLWKRTNATRTPGEPMPWLAALICASAFDIALHDAYGNSLGMDVYGTYTSQFLNWDLSHYLSADDSNLSFGQQFPADYLTSPRPAQLEAWHMVGGHDLLDPSQRTGQEPDDGYPVLLTDWIKRDGLTCLKVKLCGNDARWDYDRLVHVGTIGREHAVRWLSSDFNCTAREPAYVNMILDRLLREEPEIFQMLLYVEQPFPYDLQANRIQVHSISGRKPLFMDESAHDWKLIRLGRRLGWTGVALKTCKTQTGALLSLCWARAHAMPLMVQDLTNPMLAQIPHVSLAAHAGTIMGVETNAMQFYPAASEAESKVHPGLYRRRHGRVDLSTVRGPGLGYRINEIQRQLPAPAAAYGS